MKLPLVALAACLTATPALAEGREAVFAEMVAAVRTEFYDPAAAGAWADAVESDAELLGRVRTATTHAEWGPVARDALARLGASHTTLYTPDDAAYAQLLDIFFYDAPPSEAGHWFPDGVIETETIGVLTAELAGRTFVRVALPGAPAAVAGLRRGDELLAVNGLPWAEVAPFRGRAGEAVHVLARREKHADPIGIHVVTERLRPREMFLRAVREGARVIERDGVRVAYVPVPSYAGPWHHEAVKDALVAEPLASCDALTLDIRSGWGGASPAYLDLFNPVAPTIAFRPRGATEWSEFNPTWTKPVALLVDADTRSGKEMLAHAFKAHAIGPVVGQRTAGAVLGGSVRMLSDGSALYVAVGDARIDGLRIEGAGVIPDVEVQDELPYANGADPTLDRALGLLLEQCAADTPAD